MTLFPCFLQKKSMRVVVKKKETTAILAYTKCKGIMSLMLAVQFFLNNLFISIVENKKKCNYE